MKRLKLKKWVKDLLIASGIVALVFVSVFTNLNKISKDDLGNTCRGGIIKICSEG